MASKYSYLLSACMVLCAVHAQPVSQGSASPVLQRDSHEVLFRLGQPFKLDCNNFTLDGEDSQVKFRWLKDGQALKKRSSIEQSGRDLMFVDTQPEDEGVYTCLADTPAGTAKSAPIFVKQTYLKAPKVESKNIKAVEGKPFFLPCPVPDAYPTPSIVWMKKYKSGKSEEVSDGRITISPEGNLYFSNATENDVSNDFSYVCKAKSSAVDDDVTLAEYTVALSKNPSPDNELVQQYVSKDPTTLVAGEQAYLYCIYGGSPLAHPDWFKDSVNVNNGPVDRVTRHNRSKGKRLLIKEVLIEDAGQYSCVVDNERGTPKNYTFRVNVVSAPKFTKGPSSRLQVKSGESVFIPCEIEATPAASITWSYNAEDILNKRAKTDEKGLHLTKAEAADAGYYGCGAANDVGSVYAETLLQVV